MWWFKVILDKVQFWQNIQWIDWILSRTLWIFLQNWKYCFFFHHELHVKHHLLLVRLVMNELWKSICCCSTHKYFAFLYHFVNVTCLFSLSSHWFWSEKFILSKFLFIKNLGLVLWSMYTIYNRLADETYLISLSSLLFSLSLYHWFKYECCKL